MSGRLRSLDDRFIRATDGPRFAWWAKWVITPAIALTIAVAKLIGETRSGTSLGIGVLVAVAFVAFPLLGARAGRRRGRELRESWDARKGRSGPA